MNQLEDKPQKDLEDADDAHPLRTLITESNSMDGKIYYSIYCKSILPNYEPNRLYQVKRTHEEFAWLFSVLKSDPQYGGIVIPPAPRKPDFTFSQLITMHETDNTEWYEEELKAEYVRLFARTLNIHAEFLDSITGDERLRADRSLQHFLTYEYQLNTGSSKLNSLKSFAIGIFKTLDMKISDSQHPANYSITEVDEEIEKHKVFFKGYSTNLGNAITQGISLIKLQREYSLMLNSLSDSLDSLESAEYSKLSRIYHQLSATLEYYRKQTIKSTETEDSYLIDTFKYFYDETELCLDIILQKHKIQHALWAAQRNLDKARMTGKDIPMHERSVEKLTQELDAFVTTLKTELDKQSQNRIKVFKKKLVGYCERQIKISTNIRNNIGKLIESLEAEDFE